jgi:hypothetical protein
MKTFQLLMLGLLCATYTSNLNAQIVQIYDYFDDAPGPTNLAGTVVYATPGGGLKRFYIKNVSVAAFNCRIERVKIEEADGVFDFITCGASEGSSTGYPFGMVSPNDPFMTPDTFELSLDVNGYLGSHYLPGDSEGCSQYRYYVVNDASERIDSVDVRYCSTSGLIEDQLAISVYPNPAKGQVILEQEQVNENAVLMVTDMSGRTVYEEKLANLQKVEIDLSFLDCGLYALTLIDASAKEQIFSTKLVLE